MAEDLYFWTKNSGPIHSKNHSRNSYCIYFMNFLKTEAAIMKTFHFASENGVSKNGGDLVPFVKYSLNKKKRWEAEAGVQLLGNLQKTYKDSDVFVLERVCLRSSPYFCVAPRDNYFFHFFDLFPIRKLHQLDSDQLYSCSSTNSIRGQSFKSLLTENRASQKVQNQEKNLKKKGLTASMILLTWMMVIILIFWVMMEKMSQENTINWKNIWLIIQERDVQQTRFHEFVPQNHQYSSSSPASVKAKYKTNQTPFISFSPIFPPCPSDHEYLASPAFLSFSLHTISFISLPLHALGFYCIWYKTPSQMSSVKWLLLNLHCCCFFFDILTTLFAVPYALFPAMAGYGLGFIDSPGLFLYLMVTVITATSTSVFLIFENRYFVLFGENTWWRYARKPVIALTYIMVPIYFLPAQFMIPEQEGARKLVWQFLGCRPELPRDRELFVLSTDFTVPACSVIIAESVPGVQIATFSFILLYYLLISKPASQLSKKTIQLQRKLVFTLWLQTTVIWDLFGIPINAVVYIIKTWYISQAINNLIFFGLSVHGSISTLTLIFIHKPYRDFVLEPVRRAFRRAPTIVVKPMSPSRTFVE